MRANVPFLLESIGDAPLGKIDEVATKSHYHEAGKAIADGEAAAVKANEFEREAREARERISKHNKLTDQKIFGKPKNWHNRSTATVAYLGYMSTDSDNDLVPHGEGETWYPSGNYVCANYDMMHPNGLWFRAGADGTQSAGRMDMRQKSGYMVTEWPDGTVNSGKFREVVGGDGYTQTIGAIRYPDGSQYSGYFEKAGDNGEIRPSGFGRWSNGEAACFGFFEKGFATGEVTIVDDEYFFCGKASLGRIILRSSLNQI